jgi:hypothetical protein
MYPLADSSEERLNNVRHFFTMPLVLAYWCGPLPQPDGCDKGCPWSQHFRKNWPPPE